LRDLKVTHPSLERLESDSSKSKPWKKWTPTKKNKNKIKKCPGTRAQGCGDLVPWYKGSHLSR
jgi:hypothetical protein